MRPLLSLAALAAAAPALAQSNLPPGFVYLRDVAPAIQQDMRYATANNFTGQPLSGYNAPECVLRREAALALAQVEADLAKTNLSLKVYDCYRPARAARAMLAWAYDRKNDGAPRFYPAMRKESLFSMGYIAAYSAHSGGNTVDLTVVPAGSAVPAFDTNASYGPCTAPSPLSRAPDNSLDMGTGFDCFDPKSHTRSGAITAEQRRNRQLVLAAMARHGFKNYFREWWHFTFPGDAPHYDFAIPPRGRNLR